MTKTCKKCILSDRVEGIWVDGNGLCDYCAGRKTDEWESRFGVTEKKKRQLREELERAIDRTRGKHAYDCVVALSGGKDSSYLLHHFVNERGLKVLAVHVNTPFESEVAKENIGLLRERLSFDLKIVDPGIDFYRVFYNALFSDPVRQGYIRSVCYVCGPFFTGCCLEVATEAKIPLVFLGVSPNQPDNMFFEWGKDIVEQRHWIPSLFKNGQFSDEFREKFWNPHSYSKGTAFPRLIAPLHVMKYNEEEIKEQLSRNGILPKRKLNPVITNCALNWPMVYLDTKLLGHNPYIKEFASKVRRSEGSRVFWKSLLRMVNLQIRLGVFKRKAIKEIEEVLGLSFSECPVQKNAILRSFEPYP